VLLLVAVEAISESLDIGMKTRGSEAKKAKGEPTTSRYCRKLKLGVKTPRRKSVEKWCGIDLRPLKPQFHEPLRNK